ncbi:MAG: Na(+)-translocating NADH-quinone reductase subunit F [Capnocytophaga sp.]|nr:Na(+)-translocating NADH-quinone reductase subunit F [Capnocytophaga sp.]
MEEALTGQELHNLAMNIVGAALRDELGWEFLLVNSQLAKNPQFVCLDKNKKKHFIIVRAIPYGENPDSYDPVFMQIVRTKAAENNGKAYFAGVGLTNLENEEFPLYKNKPYKVNFKGLLEIV